MGKPAVFVVAKPFEINARLNAKLAGLSDINLVIFPAAAVPPPEEIESLQLGKLVTQGVISSLTGGLPVAAHAEERVDERLVFSGKDYPEAAENMEKHFLGHCWSDGFPLMPPTEEAVNRMLAATELPPEHVVGLVMPEGAEATVEKIAINAVMAGCLPPHMPVILAAVEAITDPRFDLLGVQCTTGAVSPLLIVSGPGLIQALNINDSFSSLGPGWRANATIGRAIRLIMINIGHAWPGNPDMKAFGSPFKYVMLLAENEEGYEGAWEPLRVAEGYAPDQPTVSVMPAVTWQVDRNAAEVATTPMLIDKLGRMARTKYDRVAVFWGMDNLVILSPTSFDAIRREGFSRSAIQKMLYEVAQSPAAEFFEGKEPSAELVNGIRMPDELIARCKADANAMVPLFRSPESIKIVVAGARVTALFAFVSTWGMGPAYFTTKPITLPAHWERMLEAHQGWETPIIRDAGR
jgi:hypothetical protein